MEQRKDTGERRPWFVQVLSLAGALLFTALAVLVAGQIAFRLMSQRVMDRESAELDRYVTLLTTEIHRFDYLPELLQYQSVIMAALRDPDDKSNIDHANRYLEAINRAAGTTTLYLLDLTGKVAAASNWNEPDAFVGVDLSYRPYFPNALRDGVGRFYGIGTTSKMPGYYFAMTMPRGGTPLGIGVVKLNLDALQIKPPSGRDDVMIIDAKGIIVLASRPAWRYRTLAPLSKKTLESLRAARQYENVELAPIGLRTDEVFPGEGAIVSLPGSGPEGVRQRFLSREKAFDDSDWKVMVLSDLSDAEIYRRWAQLAAALVAVSLVFFALFLMQRRRAIRFELAGKAILAHANAELESQVAQRTQALVDTNQRLRDTRDELIHSAKLAAIGQLAAGVTHELNQPLSAIRTLSENADTLMERSQNDAARKNMRTIVGLVDRLNRITSQLKLFARKGHASFEMVSVESTIRSCIQIVEHRIRAAHVKVDLHMAEPDICVLASAGRLDQVILNLLSNAIDATLTVNEPQIWVVVSRDADVVTISIRDNGIGLSEDVSVHLFEPFFTTKKAGAGLGLGLAISIGIISDFGGTLTAQNDNRGGAAFLIKLPVYQNDFHADVV